MNDDFITRHEHEEFRRFMESENKRLDDENKRQNHRIESLEENMQQISKLATNTEKLAANMENMLKVQEQHGNQLKALEAKDGEMWRKVVGYIITAIIGIIIGFVFKQLGM